MLIEAAVRVFARKGFHGTRVADIAAEAGVAHGLLYHYFASKDELLEIIVRETWSARLQALERIEEEVTPAREQLRRLAALVLRTWQREPDLVRVLVRELRRNPLLQRDVGEIEQALGAITRIVEQGQTDGQLRRDIDGRVAAHLVSGALQEILTGWVLGQLPDGEEDIAQAERTVVEVLAGGLVTAADPT